MRLIMKFLSHNNTIFVLLLVLVIHLELSHCFFWFQSDRVKLTDIRSLTLYAGRMTTARRTWPVPQVKCVGGNAGCRAQLDSFQCFNRGTDGFDVLWKCKTALPRGYRLGQTDVNCEGYAYATDPYVLKGSCGVEYTLYFREVPEPQISVESGALTLFFLFIVFSVVVVLALICCSSIEPRDPDPSYHRMHYHHPVYTTDDTVVFHHENHPRRHVDTVNAPTVYREQYPITSNTPRVSVTGFGHTKRRGHVATVNAPTVRREQNPIKIKSPRVSATGFGHTKRR